jgi:hypothetical protein
MPLMSNVRRYVSRGTEYLNERLLTCCRAGHGGVPSAPFSAASLARSFGGRGRDSGPRRRFARAIRLLPVSAASGLSVVPQALSGFSATSAPFLEGPCLSRTCSRTLLRMQGNHAASVVVHGRPGHARSWQCLPSGASNPSFEGTRSGLRPPRAPQVKR